MSVREQSSHVILNIMGCRSIQYGSFEDYLVAVARSCAERAMTAVFVYPEEPIEDRFRGEIERAGGRLVIIPGTEQASIPGALGLWREIRRTNPTIVHAHFGRSGYLGALLGGLGGARVVLLSKHQTSWPSVTAKTRAVYTVLSRMASGVVVGAAPVLEELPALGVGKDKRVLIPFPGVDTSRYRPRPDVRRRVRADLGVAEHAPLVVAVAHMKEQKGLRYLLPAVRLVCEEHQGATFVLVGDGAQRRELEEQALTLGVGETVRFVGHRPDIPELLAAADVFVCPSLCEGGCAGSLEAMAVGMPIVSTPVGIARDLVKRSRSGVIVPPRSPEALAQGLCEVLGQPTQWAAMGQRAREIVEKEAGVRVTADLLVEFYAGATGACRAESERATSPEDSRAVAERG